MSRLLDEALPLDVSGRRVWLERLSPEYLSLAQHLREALLPEGSQAADSKSPLTLSKPAFAHEASAATVSSLQPDARVGPYELIRLLGAGGMAEVWLARRADGAFKREVALKLPKLTQLRKYLEQRFARERDILASLEHPLIARFYDAGIDPDGLPYVAMEYLQGQPLTNWCEAHRLEIPARLQLFLQVLAAVQYAHEKHVIHRDLKPSNILVTDSGEVRLLDFGVAKLLEADEGQLTPLTSIYGRALTPDYASPELLRGDPVDARSDIYSLGVLLYEMLSGVRPYRLSSAASIGMLEQAIATIDVKKPSMQREREEIGARGTPPEKLTRQLRGDLDAITLKALAKAPAERYPSAAALADDVRRYLDGKPIEALPARFTDRWRKFVRRNRTVVGVTATAVAAILATIGYMLHRETTTQAIEKSVAVLPFLDLSEKKDQEYFADGLSEQLIYTLTKVPGLHVPARTSSFYFKGKQTTIAAIANTLGVAHVLEGSVRKSGNTIRITAELVRTDNGYQVWSETFDRQLDDIFKVQDEIATAVVKALKVSLAEGEVPRATVTSNTDAYTLYLQARYIAAGRAADADYRVATNYLQRAVTLDRKFAPAWAALANIVVDAYSWTSRPYAETRAQAQTAAEEALQIDPNLSDGHLAMGKILFTYAFDWQGSHAEYDRALEADPRNAEALRWKSYLALALRRSDEALELAQRAVAYDPLNSWNFFAVAAAHSSNGRLAESEAAYRKGLELNPAAIGLHALLGEVLVLEGEPGAALAEMQRETGEMWQQISVPVALDALGRKREADAALASLEAKYGARAPAAIAYIYACRRDTNAAILWLDRAFQRHILDVFSGTRSCLKNLDSDPRYKALLRNVNLPE